jgi:hypothetical protein
MARQGLLEYVGAATDSTLAILPVNCSLNMGNIVPSALLLIPVPTGHNRIAPFLPRAPGTEAGEPVSVRCGLGNFQPVCGKVPVPTLARCIGH